LYYAFGYLPFVNLYRKFYLIDPMSFYPLRLNQVNILETFRKMVKQHHYLI
jgi:hypothetical protein